MATLILGTVGAAIGGLTAGPGGAFKGAMLGWSIGSTIGSIVDANNTRIYNGDMGRTDDLRVTVASYGTNIPQCFGKCRIPGTIIWGTDLQEHETKKTVGGTSGGPKQITKYYTYTVSFACALCKGKSSKRIDKIYGDDLVLFDRSQSGNSYTAIFDSSSNQVGERVVSKAYKMTFRYYYGTETQNADPLIIAKASNSELTAGSDNPAFRGLCYIVFEDLLLTNFGNRIPNLSFLVSDNVAPTAGSILTDIISQTGINVSTELDVTSANAITISGGMVVGSRVDAKSAMQPILDFANLDLVHVDGKLKTVLNGGDPVATITWDDMGAEIVESENAGPIQRITKIREANMDLPKGIDIGYFSTSTDLQQATQRVVRQSVQNNNFETVSYPLTLEDNEARQFAERILYLKHAKRIKYNSSLMPYLAFLSASDVVLLQSDDIGTLTRVKIVETETGMPGGEIRTSFERDFNKSYNHTLNATTPTGGLVTSAPVPTTFLAFSGKELRDEDTTSAGFYVAASGGTGWQGAAILMSTNGGTTYDLVGSVTSRSVFGTATSALGSIYTPNSNGFDTTNTVNVSVNGTMETTSENSVKTGGGNYGVLLKSDTSVSNSANYEVFGFANVALVSAGNYTLSDLYRVQRNTLATGHTSTDKFVELSDSLVRVPVASSLEGTMVLVKCVSPGIDISAVTAQSVYIASHNPIYATDQDIADAIAAIPAPAIPPGTPMYRVRGFQTTSGYGDGVYLDEGYFGYPLVATNNANSPGGPGNSSGKPPMPEGGVKQWNEYGESILWQNSLPFVVWMRIGLKNTTSSSKTIKYWIPYVDNGVSVIWNNAFILQTNTNAGSLMDRTGTFTVAANSQAILHVMFYNKSSTSDDSANPGTFNFVLDTVDTGVTFYDAGI